MPVTTKFAQTATQRRPNMAMIYVRAKPGRKAFYEGRVIPHDNFIPVSYDPYIKRLVHHWGDLEVQGGTTAEMPTTKKTGKHAPPGAPTLPKHAAQNAPATPSASSQGAPGTGAPRPDPNKN